MRGAAAVLCLIVTAGLAAVMLTLGDSERHSRPMQRRSAVDRARQSDHRCPDGLPRTRYHALRRSLIMAVVGVWSLARIAPGAGVAEMPGNARTRTRR